MRTQRKLSPELQEQLKLEEKANQARMAVLSDAQFMAGVAEAQAAEGNGDEGRPWDEVKRELRM